MPTDNLPLRAELARLLPRLQSAYPRSEYLRDPAATLDVFAAALDGTPLRALAPAVDAAVRTKKFWPAPAELRSLAWDAERALRGVEGSPAPRPARTDAEAMLTCPQCGCRVRYFERPGGGTARLVSECEARREGLVLAANQAGTPWADDAPRAADRPALAVMR